LENVSQYPHDISKKTADHFRITRQGVNKHLQRLYAEGALTQAGRTRNRIYKLTPLSEERREYQIAPGLEEDQVWRNDISGILGNLPANIRDLWHYGFTEMFNNALAHSAGSEIMIFVTKTAADTEMLVSDNGVGIFKKIQTELNLLDERHALLELSKGKLTTDPKHHTGEGIFFTSRMFDSFDILSGGTFFTHKFTSPEDWLLERQEFKNGTAVWMKLNNHTARTLKKIFDQFSTGDNYGFNKTVVPVRLAQYSNDRLISRSQARRVLARVELFKTVLFDFEEVPLIGQAFADEIFRVFASEHPEIELIAINANSEVSKMIRRAQAGQVGA
jgi:anti-sigma regulatory factor (Ser/Thr protein kinase)